MLRPNLKRWPKLLAASLTFPLGITPSLQAQTQWAPVDEINAAPQRQPNWETIAPFGTPPPSLVWEPLTPEQEILPPEKLVWTDTDQQQTKEVSEIAIEKDQESGDLVEDVETTTKGFRWPNGQLMSEADQIYFRTAYSRGSMIQIGDTVYPNLGYNALQRKLGSWVNLQVSAIDDSLMTSPSPCEDGDFFDQCADGLMTNWVRLWADRNFSADLQWTIHSLSGEGAPFSFTTDSGLNFGSEDGGTKFGDGQSLGFRISKNFGKTFGISLGADRLYHFDKLTDLPKNFYLMGTKVFRLSDTFEPPILSLSVGLMSDTYNPSVNIGSVRYPKAIRGGRYPSIFSAAFDNFDKETYSANTAGASSAFVCAERSIFAGKPFESLSKSCIEEVFIGPIGSIGFAPWPWIGTYAIYNGWDLNFGISLKPFKEIHWTFSLELVSPIAGLNPGTDRHMNFSTCPDDNYSFSACRTRLGIFTDLSF